MPNFTYNEERYKNINLGIIENCIFKDVVSVTALEKNLTFKNCIFEKELKIRIQQKDSNNDGLELLSNKSFEIIGGKIEKLKIINSDFKSKFYINKQSDKNEEQTKITNLIIKDTIFKENFKLHNCKVENIIIEDTDFIKNADFFKSEFTAGYNENEKDKSIYFKAINFESLALFGDTTFQEKLVFKYVTFKGHNHFINATLHKGLDLEYTNIQNEMNFYSLNILDTSQTSQETYRIIKHNFEKIGNKIEANKYHALELEQKKINLENNKSSDWKEKWVFKFHHWSSNHSTNWFLALKWIILTSFLTVLFLNFNIVIDLLTKKILFKFEYICKAWNEFWSYLYILNKDEKLLESPFIFLLNKISLGYLYYQFLLSVRKDTRK